MSNHYTVTWNENNVIYHLYQFKKKHHHPSKSHFKTMSKKTIQNVDKTLWYSFNIIRNNKNVEKYLKLELGDLPVDVFINSTVGVLSECIHVSHHPIGHFKHIAMLSVITAQKSWKNKKIGDLWCILISLEPIMIVSFPALECVTGISHQEHRRPAHCLETEQMLWAARLLCWRSV